ncbi:MAG: hypothetical protein QOH57_603, partial [Mycobacterium sp.]|nr:hypothetical protein [Mycobacterium sp.]
MVGPLAASGAAKYVGYERVWLRGDVLTG